MKRLFEYYKSMPISRRVTHLIRIILIMAIMLFAAGFFWDSARNSSTLMGWPDIEMLLAMVFTLALTFSFDYLEKKHAVFIPHVIATTSIVFVFCALFLGTVAGFYAQFWWWDDLLHMFSGVILGLVGFLLVYYFNSRFSMNLSPFFVALFALTFAVFIGVMWEIYEFTADAILGSNAQKWRADDTGFLLGRDYQGSAVRDTMSDLIVDVIGGLLASGYAYYLFKNENQKALEMMRKTFGDKA